MERDDLKDMARLALEEFSRNVLQDPSSYNRGHNVQAALDDVIGALKDRLDIDPEAINPSYRRQDELAASMIVLAATMPEAYRRLTQQVATASDQCDANTLPGLNYLAYFLKVLGDDHDFVVVRDDDGPTLHLDGHLPYFVPLVTPAGLLQEVGPVLDGISATPKM